MVMRNATWKAKLLTAFRKKVIKLRSITISEKLGKNFHNMGTEQRIFHVRINLVSDKFWKFIEILYKLHAVYYF